MTQKQEEGQDLAFKALEPDMSQPLLYRWGQAVALFESAIPGGLTTFARNNAAAAPVQALPLMAHKLVGGNLDVVEVLERWLESFGCKLPEQTSREEQGQVLLGYYSLRNKLPESPKQGSRTARREAWEEVDWTCPDARIAEDMKVSREAVRKQRKKRGEA